jgi:hypothetical protein
MPDSEYHVYTHLITDRKNYTGFVQYKEKGFQQFVRLDFKGFLKNPLKNSLFIKQDSVYILEREDLAKLRNAYK